MAYTRNSTLIKNELIRYITSLGIDVYTGTKARGNRGFFKAGRIDISKTLDDTSAIRVILHEYAHYANYKLDKNLNSLVPLFGEESQIIKEELFNVTMFVDENSVCLKLNSEAERLKSEIKQLTDSIKNIYPKFSLTSEFKEFKRYSYGTDLRYLEKYDRVKVRGITSSKIYSVADIKRDFPDIPEVFSNYLILKSCQRKRTKITRRISKLTKYYNEPCELFARFTEGLYKDIEKVKTLAPTAFSIFKERYNKGYYKGLQEIFSVVRIIL